MSTSSLQARRVSRFSRGFTLVEVCLSLGIMTVTLVPLLGLMANGLAQVGTNIDSNQAVNICQQVFVGAQQQSFSTLVQSASATATASTYYTASGDSVPAGSSSIVYTASVSRTLSTVTAPTPPLVTLVIKVRKTPGGTDAPKNPAIATFVGTVSCPDISGYNAGTN